ncbi:MAG: tetratricopeptide repeat protein [Phaeodactylibacter sp.]|nr:tetratricopeptide repeat protein [Phaeodactylibacter sp.]MCB9048346.1 tetratricopeptide repeat protein [Lewinellaceae bacterium]
MKTKALFIGILLLFPFAPGQAQLNEIDSLKAVLQTSGKDTTRVNTLVALGSRIFRSQPEEALAYSNEAIELSISLDFPKGQAYALKNIGLAYFVKGNYDKVLDYWERSLAIFQSIDDQLGVGNLLNNIGAVYFNQGNDPKALEYYLESLRVSEKLGDKLRIATALTNIGAVYFNDPANHDKARDYYLRAVGISEETGDLEAIGTSLVNLGEIYLEREQLDSALYYFQKSIEALDISGGDPYPSYAYALNNIGKVYAARGDYQEALKFHTQAYQAAKSVEAKREMALSLTGLGNVNLALARRDNGGVSLAKALSYFEDAFREAQSGDLKPEMEKAALGLYLVYKEQKNYPEALKYHEIYENTKDALLNEDRIKSIALLGAEYEFEKEKQQLEYELEAKLRRQRSVQYATAAGLLVALVLIVILVQYYRLKRIRATEKFEAQRQLIMQDKLASLGQITAGIAHEIKNPLNFVTNFAEGSVDLGNELVEVIADNEDKLPPGQYELLLGLAADLSQNAKDIRDNGIRADRVVKRMMEQARGDKGEPQKVDINTLIEENIHLAYHGYRANAPGFNIDIEKSYDPSLPPVEVIPQDLGRVILNIFHNACYALHEKQEQNGAAFHAAIRVSTETQKGKAVIRLRDNGPGIPEKVREKIFQPFFTTKPAGTGNTGLGLSISHDLIVIGHQGELEVNSEPGEYTEFVIRLPLNRPQ